MKKRAQNVKINKKMLHHIVTMQIVVFTLGARLTEKDHIGTSKIDWCKCLGIEAVNFDQILSVTY